MLGRGVGRAQNAFEHGYLVWPFLGVALLIVAMYLCLGFRPVRIEAVIGITLTLVSVASTLLVFTFWRELMATGEVCGRRRRLGYVGVAMVAPSLAIGVLMSALSGYWALGSWLSYLGSQTLPFLCCRSGEKQMTNCEHHFDIPANDGDSSTGVCRHCGIAKEFRNKLTIEDKPGRRKGKAKAKSIDPAE